MTVARATALVDAPVESVAGAARSVDVVLESLRGGGHHVVVPARADGLLQAQDVVRVVARVGVLPLPLALRVVSAGVAELELVRQSGSTVDARHRSTVVATGAGALLTEELRWTGRLGPLGRVADALAVRRVVVRALEARTSAVAREAVRLRDAREVVAGAIVRDGQVLLARRSWPPALAGQWELPGGGVEPGESSHQALARELDDALPLPVRAGAQLGVDVPLPGGRVLRARVAHLEHGEPRAREHSELRWVGPAELWSMDLVAADRAWRAELESVLL